MKFVVQKSSLSICLADSENALDNSLSTWSPGKNICRILQIWAELAVLVRLDL